jgi:hypothetical protein
MTTDFEKELREALRPVDPAAGFADRVISRIERERPSRRGWRPRKSHWVPVALAASAVLAAVLVREWEVHRERQGLEARAQLIDALRVTGEKLDLAYRSVNDAGA